MEPNKPFSDSPQQIALQEAELAALLRMLDISEGTFSLSLAICNSPALRDYLIGKIKEDNADIEIIPIEKDTTRIFSFVEKKINNKKPSAIFITEIEKAVPSDDTQSKLIRTLNASRELWQEKFSCPVVFWLPEYASTLLSIHARDLWSWLSHIFEFVSEQATAAVGMLDAYAGDITSASKLDADQKRFRIAELEQRIEDAGDPSEQRFAKYVLTWLSELAYIYKAIGDLDTAEKNILKSLRIKEKYHDSRGIASDYTNLGLIYLARGDLDKAEQRLKESLEVYKRLGLQTSAAIIYGNLGVVFQTRGDLDKAKQMHNEALEIEQKLGRLDGIARAYGNLGVIHQMRGDLDEAEQMLNKSLEIDTKLGWFEGIANQYSNLGGIHRARGDLVKAEQMVKKALEIYKRLGQLGYIANQYSNLGLIYQTHGDIKKAREYWEKALELYEKIGMKPEIEKTQRLIARFKEN